jgi:hypothetical protein
VIDLSFRKQGLFRWFRLRLPTSVIIVTENGSFAFSLDRSLQFGSHLPHRVIARSPTATHHGLYAQHQDDFRFAHSFRGTRAALTPPGRQGKGARHLMPACTGLLSLVTYVLCAQEHLAAGCYLLAPRTSRSVSVQTALRV